MANEVPKGAGTPVMLRDRYGIYPGAPLADFSTPTGQAFHADDRRAAIGDKPLFALLVRPGLPCRPDAMRILKGIEHPALMTLVDWGVIDWPPIRRKVVAVIYERPTGGRVMADLGASFKRVEDHEVIRKVVLPAVGALREMAKHNLTHRAVRPTNLFWATPDHDSIVLGDCTTSPPGFDQPPMFETIESMMTHQAARGAGSFGDDLYAFGVSLVVMLLGRNPVPNMEDDQLIRAKMADGTYNALTSDDRMPIQVIELLRGLLSDEPRQRWSHESLEQWIAGRRLPTTQTRIEKRAARGFPFLEREYYNARELALAFSRNWDAAVTQVSDGRLELWVRRSIDNKDMANEVATAVGTAGYASSDKRVADEILLCKICLILDRQAPLRYKTLAVMPDGIGSLLSLTMAEGADVRLLAEMLVREVHKTWMETREYTPESATLDTKLKAQRPFLERASIGNGIERVLYEVNENAPCMSPYTIDDYVVELKDLLPALNAYAKKGEGKWPIDRHVAAFLAARANFDIARQMSEIGDPSLEKSGMAMLDLLAMVQWRQGQTGLYGLTSWIGGLVQPIINSYHNRQKRKDLEREVPKLVRQGNLVDLARLLDNADERYKDRSGFEQACNEWKEAAREIREINAGRDSRGEEAAKTAQQIAALVSVTASLLATLGLAIARLF